MQRGREREGEQNENVLFLHIASFIKKVGSQGNLLLTFGQEGRRKRREEGKERRRRGAKEEEEKEVGAFWNWPSRRRSLQGRHLSTTEGAWMTQSFH